MKKGILYGIGAYLCWGTFPLYWRLLKDVSAAELLAHRVIWSFSFLVLFILISGGWDSFQKTLSLRVIASYSIASLIIGVNWFVYVKAVNSGYILETSLGYFINPLLNMLFGIIFFRERFRPVQWVPLIIAASGVGWLTVAYGHPPYIALTLAFSFALYGVVKKVSPLGSLHGLAIETGVLLVPAVCYLAWGAAGGGAFISRGVQTSTLIAGAGIITLLPLLMFATAARSVPLWILGLVQYISPTMNFLIGTLILKEPFTSDQLIGFGFVWTAIIIFLAENWYSKFSVAEETP